MKKKNVDNWGKNLYSFRQKFIAALSLFILFQVFKQLHITAVSVTIVLIDLISIHLNPMQSKMLYRFYFLTLPKVY